MKYFSIFLIIIISLLSCKTDHLQSTNSTIQSIIQTIDTSDMTNNFYDNTETNALPVKELIVDGEIENPGKVDLSEFKLHSVIVKEAILDSTGEDRFVGAYRYDGYSLFDILNERIINKSNDEEFNPIIDLYIEILNENGEKVVFSWGELYYPNNLHKIIIAANVSRIVPSKTNELWPLPAESKIVAANDLVTERNISAPVKITVKSFPHSFIVNRDLSPLYSDHIDLFISLKLAGKIEKIPEGINNETFNTIFYGRGRGIHSTTPFSGILLKDILLDYYPVSRKNLQSGIMCIAGIDGYRCAVSYSELFNRNDQQEILLISTDYKEDGGRFRIFAAADFFSDRAIKSVSEIHLGY
jgi:hypothetical protein